MALDPALDLGARQSAMQVLGYTRTPAAIATLASLATESEPRIRYSVTPTLVASSEAVALEATRALLTDPATPDSAFSGIYACNEAVWDAWQATNDPRLLVALGRCRDERIIEPVADALRDPGLGQQDRDELASIAGTWLRDPRLVPALVKAAGFGGLYARKSRSLAHWRCSVRRAKRSRSFRRPSSSSGPMVAGLPSPPWGRSRIPRPATPFWPSLPPRRPSWPPRQSTLFAWHPSPAAAALIEPLLDDPTFTCRYRRARDDAPARGDGGAGSPVRGRGPPRDARPRPAPRWSSPHTVARPAGRPRPRGRLPWRRRPARPARPTGDRALLDAVDHADPDVAVCATHALISMASPRTPEALERLAANPDQQARRLAAAWQSDVQLEFRLLGEFAVLADGQRLDLGGPRQRSVLALLLLQRDRAVSTAAPGRQTVARRPATKRHQDGPDLRLAAARCPGRRSRTTQLHGVGLSPGGR